MTFARILPDVYYVNGNPIPASYFQSLDANQHAAINGDAGGSWGPTSPIIIGGAGVWIAGDWDAASGPAIVPQDGKARLTHGANDWIQLLTGHPGRSRAFIVTLGIFVDASTWTPGQPENGQPKFIYDGNFNGARVSGAGAGFGGARMLAPLRVHNGATLAGVFFNFAIGDPHSSGLPVSQPKFRVFSLSTKGVVTNLCTDTTVAGYVGNGYVQLQAADHTAYWESGGPQVLIYTIDAGTVVDTSLYTYFVDIVDEAGANSVTGTAADTPAFSSGNVYYTAVVSLTDITDLRPQ